MFFQLFELLEIYYTWMSSTLHVTGPILEQAGRSMYQGTIEQQQSAADFLAAWKSSSDALLSAAQFLSCDFSNVVQFISSAVVFSAVTDTWFKYDRDSLNQIRQSLCSFAFSHVCQNDHLISEKMTSIIAAIAFNDWPDNWPEFLPEMCNAMQASPAQKRLSMVILQKFLEQVYTSQKITMKRRSTVLATFLTHIDQILSQIDIINCIDDQDLVSAYLDFAVNVTKAPGISESFVSDYSSFLFHTFVLNDKVAAMALQAIENMGYGAFTSLLPTLVEYVQTCQTQQHSVADGFHPFLCRILTSLITSMTGPLDDSNTLQALLKLLEGTLVFHDRNSFVADFWIVWTQLLVPRFEIFYRPLLPVLIPAFYELLPMATSLSRLVSPLVGMAFLSLAQLAPAETFQFLAAQGVSHSLCFAVGILKHESLYPKLSETVGFCNPDSSLDVVSSVLFALSRNTEAMEHCADLVTKLEQIVSTFLFKSPDYQTTVLLALNHVASGAPSLLFHGDLSFVRFLFDSVDPSKLEDENLNRICRILAKLALKAPPEVKDAVVGQLTKMACEFLEASDPVLVVVGAQIVWSIGSLSLCGSHIVTSHLWHPLLKALCTHREAPVFDDIIVVFPSAVRTSSWSICKKTCKEFMKLVLTITGHDEAILDAYNQIVQCHWQLKDYRDAVAGAFVQKLIDQPPAAFFEFFQVTELKPHEEDVVMNAACTAIVGFDMMLAKAAALMARVVVRRRKDPAFLEKWQLPIMRAVFKALFDNRCVKVFRPVSKLLFTIYKTQNAEAVDEHALAAILEVVEDPEFSRVFVMALRNASPDRERFMITMNDLLTTSGVVNPSDIRLFLAGIEAGTAQTDMPCVQNEDEFVNE